MLKTKTLKKKKTRGKYLAPSSRPKLTTIIMSPTKGQAHLVLRPRAHRSPVALLHAMS